MTTRNRRNQPWLKQWLVTGAAALLAVATLGASAAVVSAQSAPTERSSEQQRQRADVMTQGGEDRYQRNGARLIRTDHSLEVQWSVRTPATSSYAYPTPDMVPPGAPIHPPIEPGATEVFTLWLFAFDLPGLCTDNICDMDDIGDTPARGSVYQIDGEIAYGRNLFMKGKVRLGQSAVNGLGLSNPFGAEVHVAMAPHGAALDGAALSHQLNSAVGGPPLWFASAFLPDN